MTLRVILQIVPRGDETQVREIGRLDINNMGRDTSGLSHYEILNLSRGEAGQYQREILHDREDGAWRLVEAAIKYLDITGPS